MVNKAQRRTPSYPIIYASVLNATEDFADAALWVLKRRIKNSPPERWLFGWISRLNTYR